MYSIWRFKSMYTKTGNSGFVSWQILFGWQFPWNFQCIFWQQISPCLYHVLNEAIRIKAAHTSNFTRILGTSMARGEAYVNMMIVEVSTVQGVWSDKGDKNMFIPFGHLAKRKQSIRDSLFCLVKLCAKIFSHFGMRHAFRTVFARTPQ